MQVLGSVPAGFPSPAADHFEEQIDLNKHLQKNPSATFFVRAQGNSMQDAFIADGSLLVVDRSIRAQHGHIILAVLNGEFTVKYLKKNAFKCWLVPGNRHYPETEITPEMNMQVWGVVTYIITDTKDVRRCML